MIEYVPPRIRPATQQKEAWNISIKPSQLDFGKQPVNSKSSYQTLRVTNEGYESVVISNLKISGDYAVSDNYPSVLEPNQTVSIKVAFAPRSGGPSSGSLLIDIGSKETNNIILLKGEGLEQE